MTLRERLADCEAFHEFEELTGMHMSEGELESIERIAIGAGLTIEAYLAQALDRVKKAQARLRERNRTIH